VTDYGHDLEFGVFVTAVADAPVRVVELSVLADREGLDLVTFQDHPYQPRFLDTWTLMSFVAARTMRARLAPNVLSLPLRPPAVVARSVASLPWSSTLAQADPELAPVVKRLSDEHLVI
jgi:alkanesulfonate monooxygenase SsuD/methylene tetrahydromethanopterin reductase-like flavin-dependent oxidoreductase (luciferase family)